MFFSIAMLVTNALLWIISLAVFVSLIIYERKENDEYGKALFDIGIFFVFLYIYIAWMPLRLGFIKELVISMIVGVLFYELGVFLNIKLKKYSLCTKKLRKETILGTSGVLTGLGIGRFISQNANSDVTSLGLVFISVVFFMFSIACLQRYIFYKILKKYYS